MDAALTLLPHLLTPADVAGWLSLPARQVKRLARRGDIPAVELPGGELVFDADDLREWLRRRKAAVWRAED
jgi:excisionase family DNA binding protein